jgi:hypothetical protein
MHTDAGQSDLNRIHTLFITRLLVLERSIPAPFQAPHLQ